LSAVADDRPNWPNATEDHVSDLKALQHPRFSRAYLRISQSADQRGAAEHRHRMLADLTGRVIEIGAGGGRNFSHYPETVTEVVAVEPDDTLRGYAEQAAAGAPVPVRVVEGSAEQLPAQDDEFDAAVFSLVLCSIANPSEALREAARVLRSGGQLRFLEHVRSAHRLAALLEDAVTPLWQRAFGGCHPNRDTAATIAAAGFTIDHIERFGFAIAPIAPPTAHILGRATKP
jgi:ubiquinone/menaquinone biosynthesis C-methylase UbiE